jgi:dTDP-4-amino-4,6-dideoxygalactose transaminase
MKVKETSDNMKNKAIKTTQKINEDVKNILPDIFDHVSYLSEQKGYNPKSSMIHFFIALKYLKNISHNTLDIPNQLTKCLDEYLTLCNDIITHNLDANEENNFFLNK